MAGQNCILTWSSGPATLISWWDGVVVYGKGVAGPGGGGGGRGLQEGELLEKWGAKGCRGAGGQRPEE